MGRGVRDQSAARASTRGSRHHSARDTVREFWLDRPTGYVRALESDRADRVIAAAAPLAVNDAAPALLGYLLYRAREVPWIVHHRLGFVRLGSVSQRGA